MIQPTKAQQRAALKARLTHLGGDAATCSWAVFLRTKLEALQDE